MTYVEGDDVLIVGPNNLGFSGYVGQPGEIVKYYKGAFDENCYVVDLEGTVMGFPETSLRLSEEDSFDDDNVLQMVPPKEDLKLQHIITIHGNNFMMTTKEVKDLKNLLAAII